MFFLFFLCFVISLCNLSLPAWISSSQSGGVLKCFPFFFSGNRCCLLPMPNVKHT